MPRIALGTHVEVDGLRGVVVRHSPQGMVDVQPDGEDFIIRKRESALHRLNPGKGSPPLRVRREVEKMLHNPPSSWKALYRRMGLPAKPSVEDFIDTVRGYTPSGRSAEAYYGREMGQGRHVPSKAVREAALHGLRLSYDNNYTSESGVGLARAVQLVLDPSIDDLAKTRMQGYLSRHERDKQAKNFGNDKNPSDGYMAWLNWGGDPAKEWLGMRNNPAGRKPDVMKKQDAQFQAVVQGIYETLMAKHLGVEDLYLPTGERIDLIAFSEGDLSKREVRDTLSRAFAIATRQGQKHGYLRPGSREPTAKGRRRAYARFKDRDLRAQNAQDYEVTLAMARKSSPLRVVQKGRGKSKKFFVEPHIEGVSKRGYKTQLGAVNAIERVMGLRMNPGPLDDMVADLDGDPNTVSLGELWDDFDEWVETSKERLLPSASKYHSELIQSLKSMYGKRGMTPLEAKRATAREFIQHYNDYTGVFAPQMRKAVVGIVRKLDPTLLRRTLQTTSEEKARERSVRSALEQREQAQRRAAFRSLPTSPEAKITALRNIFMETVLDILGEATPTSRAEERALRDNIQMLGPNVMDLLEDLNRATPTMPKAQLQRLVDRTRAFTEFQKGRFMADVVGQSEVEGPAFAAGVRSGKEESERRKASKAKGKVKAAIGRKGDGIGALSRKGSAAEDRTFTAPPGFQGADYVSLRRVMDEEGNEVTAAGLISYDVAGNGNMTLFFSEGDTLRRLSLNVPDAVAKKVYSASSAEEANEIMSLMGRTPLGIQPMSMQNGKIVYAPITPTEVQTILDEKPEANFRKLAQYIWDNGSSMRERVMEYVPPRIDLAEVTVFDDRLGKPTQTTTYVIHGVGGNVRRIQEAIRRSQPRRKTWTSWKEAGAKFSDPKGTWNTRGSHRTVGHRGKYYVVGPLVGEGYSASDYRKYTKWLRQFANLPAELQKKYGDTLSTVTPDRFTFKTKTAAEAVRKRLDRKLGTKRVPLDSLPGYYGFYIRPEKQGPDLGYAAAVALADELGVDGPGLIVPQGRGAQVARLAGGVKSSMDAPRPEEVALSMRAAKQSILRDRLVQETEDKYNKIGRMYTNALKTARDQNDQSEINRLSGINARCQTVRLAIKMLNDLRSEPKKFEMLRQRIIDTLDDIEDTF